VPKHVVVPYVENILYSTNKYSFDRKLEVNQSLCRPGKALMVSESWGSQIS